MFRGPFAQNDVLSQSEHAGTAIVHRTLFFVSVVFLSFVAGSLLTTLHEPYGDYLHKVQMYFGASYEAFREDPSEKFHENLWFNARTRNVGVHRYDEQKADNGLTFFTDQSPTAYLITMKGEVVHQWHLPFSTAWPNPTHIEGNAPPDYLIHWRRASLFRNGDVLAIYEGMTTTPYGFGLVKIDDNSDVIWTYSERAHHDLAVAQNGTIFVFIHAIENSVPFGIPNIRPPIIHDYIAVLSPEGKELKRISMLSAFWMSEYRAFLDFHQISKGDLLHANAVDIAGKKEAERYPFIQPGDLLVSFRDIHTIAVLDPDLEIIKWASAGIWRFQHDPDFLENGSLLICDNLGNRGPGGPMRIIEINPLTKQVDWHYSGSQNELLISRGRSSQQRLPNGNTLITESENGRIFEVTKGNKIVWEFYNRSRGGINDELVGIVNWGTRIDPSTLGFLDPIYVPQ